MSKLSIIMPVLDEGDGIAATLDALGDLRARGAEVIVVDGGSRDATVALARRCAGSRLFTAPRGRAVADERRRRQGSAATCCSSCTPIPGCRRDADLVVLERLERSGRAWGRFDVSIEGRRRCCCVVGWLMNLRSRLTGIATGDQAIFVRRDAFEAIGGFPDIPADGGHRAVASGSSG